MSEIMAQSQGAAQRTGMQLVCHGAHELQRQPAQAGVLLLRRRRLARHVPPPAHLLQPVQALLGLLVHVEVGLQRVEHVVREGGGCFGSEAGRMGARTPAM